MTLVQGPVRFGERICKVCRAGSVRLPFSSPSGFGGREVRLGQAAFRRDPQLSAPESSALAAFRCGKLPFVPEVVVRGADVRSESCDSRQSAGPGGCARRSARCRARCAVRSSACAADARGVLLVVGRCPEKLNRVIWRIYAALRALPDALCCAVDRLRGDTCGVLRDAERCRWRWRLKARRMLVLERIPPVKLPSVKLS